MTNKPLRAKLPPEWDQQEFVLIAWPHADTDWNYMLDEVTDCYVRVAEAISKYAKLLIVTPHPDQPAQALSGKVADDRLVIVALPTNDTWARDFGMICVKDADGKLTINDYKFNGWGLKFASNFDNLITRGLVDCGVVKNEVRYNNLLNFVLEGGSIDIDEHATLLTTTECLLSPNRNGASSRVEIEKVLIDTLGAERVLWLEHGYLEGDDTDSHVDTLARFLPGGIIAYTACDRPDDSHYAALKAMEKELASLSSHGAATFLSPTDEQNTHATYKLVPLPIPEAIYDEDGQRLPATYANFLLLNGVLLLPVYGDRHYDEMAINALRDALPDWEIVPVDCRSLIKQHGSLHCITMQIPHGVISA